MASAEVIRASLQHAAATNNAALLRQVYENISSSLVLADGNAWAGRAGLDALVICAETSIKVGDVKTARNCLDTYLIEARRYSGAAQKVDIADQYMVRALFALGLLVAEHSKPLKGQALVDGVLESIKYIAQGLELAAGNTRYAYLVYNGSVHYWQASRPLQREQMRAKLLPSQEKVCQALDKIEGQFEWKVRQLANLALCQFESGKADEANKTLAKAVDLASKQKLPIKEEVVVLQMHLQAVAKAATAAAGSKPTPPSVAATPAAGKGKGGDGSAVVVDEDGALMLLQWVLSARPDVGAAEQQLGIAWAKVDPRPEGPAKGFNLRLVGRIAWAAAVSGCPSLAERCASRAAASQDLNPRVWSDLARALLSLGASASSGPAAAAGALAGSAGAGAAAGAAGAKNVAAPNAAAAGAGAAAAVPAEVSSAVRVRALEALEEVAAAFTKLRDAEGIHCCAKLIWNTGLPLLQPELRRSVKRPFAAAAKALEAIGSPLHRLRAQLHLEIGKCEAAEDALLKAAKEVNTALSLDYPAPQAERTQYGFDRPLDRHAAPLQRAFALKTSMDGDTGGPENEATLAIERARESRNPAIKADYLQRAIDKLMLLKPAQPPAATHTGADRAALQVAARRRTSLWADVASVAWAAKLEGLVRAAAPWVMAQEWEGGSDKEMLRLQAKVSFMEAEACLAAIKKLHLVPVPPMLPSEGKPELEDGIRLPSNTDEQLQALVTQAVVKGVQLAMSLGESWLAANGATIAWNAYLPLLHKLRYAELAPLLTQLLTLLLGAPEQQGQQGQQQGSEAVMDGKLLCSYAEAGAQAAEHVVLLALLKPAASASAVAGDDDDEQEEQGEEEGQEEEEKSESAQQDAEAAAFAFRQGRTAWYEPLQQARVKAASLDIPKLISTDPSLQPLSKRLSDAAEHCQKALARAGPSAQPQALLQAYARLQALRGLPLGLPAGAPASSEQTSKVLGVVEAVSSAVVPDGGVVAAGAAGGAAGAAAAAGAGATAPAGAATAAAMVKLEADIREAMKVLAGLPPNLELWAKLARAAGSKGLWTAAAECAAAAQAALPAGTELEKVTAAGQLPGLAPNEWYWLAVAEMQRGQAILALLKPSTQEAGVQLALRHKAISHFVNAVRFASFVRRGDLAETAARLLWNAAGGLVVTPPTKCALVAPLAAAAEALNAAKPKDTVFQVTFNCLLLDCLASAGKWRQALLHCDTLQRLLPKAGLKEVAAWRAAALAHVGHRVLEEMNCLMSEHPQPDTKAHAWQSLAQQTSSRYDQLAARKAALEAAGEHAPAMLRAGVLIEAAEWMAATGAAGMAGVAEGPVSAEELLLTAADLLSSLEEPAAGSNDASGTSNRPSRNGSATSQDQHSTSKPPSRGTTATPGYNTPPAALLEALIRAHIMLSHVAAKPADRHDHLLSAQHYACRLLTGALQSAGALPPGTATAQETSAAVSGSAAERRTTTDKPPAAQAEAKSSKGAGAGAKAGSAAAAAPATQQQPPAPQAPSVVPSNVLPSGLVAWGSWAPDTNLLTKLQEDSTAAALSSTSLGASERVLAYLELLLDGLVTAGFTAQCLPLCQLGMLIAKVARKSQALSSALALRLVELLDTLGLSGPSAYWLAQAQPDTPLSAADLQQSAQEAAMLHLVQGVVEKQVGVGRLRTPLGAGGRLGRVGSTAARKGGRVAAIVATGTPASDTAPLHTSVIDQGMQAAEPGAAASWGGCGVFMETGEVPSLGVVRFMRPLTMHDVWLRRGAFLTAHGMYSAARELLGRVLEQARCHGDDEAESQALLLLAHLEALVGQPTAAVELLQSAQAAGGSIEHWRDSVALYAKLRAGMRGGGEADALRALEGGVQLLQAVARSDRAAANCASAAAAALKLQLSQHLLAKMRRLISEREPGVNAAHERALATAKEAAAQLLEAGSAAVAYVEALLQVADLMEADPAPRQQDDRPRLGAVLDVLHTAEAAATHLHLSASPANTQGATLPTARLLARVRLGMATIELQLARAQALFAEEDRQRRRPVLPDMPGRPKEGVLRFVDEAADQDIDPHLQHEDSALLHATSAANLTACPATRAAALCLTGQALLHKVWAALPPGRRPLPPPLEAAAVPTADAIGMQGPAEDGQGNGAGVEGDGGDADTEAGVTAAGGGVLQEGQAAEGAERDAVGTSTAANSSAVPVLGYSTAGLASVAERSEVMSVGASEHAGAAADGSSQAAAPGADAASDHATAATPTTVTAASEAHAAAVAAALTGPTKAAYDQGLAALQRALAAALQAGHLPTVAETAMQLVRSYGQLAPQAAAEHLALAQSAKAAAAMRSVFERSASGQHPEVLMWRQLAQIEAAKGGSAAAGLLQKQAEDTLSAIGITHALTRIGPESLPLLQPALQLLQPETRVLMLTLHNGPDGEQELYVAALNLPDTQPEAASASLRTPRQSTAGTKPSAAKGAADRRASVAGAVKAAGPRPVLLGSLRLGAERLAALCGAFAAYRKWLAKRAVEVSSMTVALPGSPTSGKPQPRRGPSSVTAATATAAAGGKKGAPPAEECGNCVPPEPVFGPDANERWRELLLEMEELLAPLIPLLLELLPLQQPQQQQQQQQQDGPSAESSGTSAEAKPKGAAATKAAAAGATAAAPQLPQLLLLLDPELCALPWEAMPSLRDGCSSVGRCFSLAMLRALQQLPATGPPSLLNQGSAAAGDEDVAVPVLDLAKLCYIADPLHEASTGSRTPGPYAAPILPAFNDKLVPTYGKTWKGVAGAPKRVPSDAEYAGLLAQAPGLLYMGLGRFMAYVAPKAVAGLDLRACSAALLLDHANNAPAAQRQLYLDNRKYPGERDLESSVNTAMLLMLRGVRCVALNTAATAPWANAEVAVSVFKGLAEGKNVGEAVWVAQQGLSFELECVRVGGMVVYGLPYVAAGAAGAGGGKKDGKGGKAAAGAAKK